MGRPKIAHEEPGTVLRGPPIAITCACGRRQPVRYGDAWTCPDCSRVWDTSDVPREDYEEIRRITLRFRVLPVVLGLLVATVARTAGAVARTAADKVVVDRVAISSTIHHKSWAQVAWALWLSARPAPTPAGPAWRLKQCSRLRAQASSKLGRHDSIAAETASTGCGRRYVA
jgi:hypothetical protein